MESLPGDPREAGVGVYGVDGMGRCQRENPQAAGLHDRLRYCAWLCGGLLWFIVFYHVTVEEGP